MRYVLWVRASSIATTISEPLCTLRVHYMLMRSSIVLESMGHVPLITLCVGVCICPIYVYVCMRMCMDVCI